MPVFHAVKACYCYSKYESQVTSCISIGVTQSGASPVTDLMTDSMNKPMTDPRTHTRMDPIPDPMNDLISNTNIVMPLQFRTLAMFSLNEPPRNSSLCDSVCGPGLI